MTITEVLAKLEAADKAATKGPWFRHGPYVDGDFTMESYARVAQVLGNDGRQDVDGDAIVAIRNALPGLLAWVREARTTLAVVATGGIPQMAASHLLARDVPVLGEGGDGQARREANCAQHDLRAANERIATLEGLLTEWQERVPDFAPLAERTRAALAPATPTATTYECAQCNGTIKVTSDGGKTWHCSYCGYPAVSPPPDDRPTPCETCRHTASMFCQDVRAGMVSCPGWEAKHD